MDKHLVETLSDTFGFQRWAGRNTLGDDLFISRFVIAVDDDFAVVRTQRVERPVATEDPGAEEVVAGLRKRLQVRSYSPSERLRRDEGPGVAPEPAGLVRDAAAGPAEEEWFAFTHQTLESTARAGVTVTASLLECTSRLAAHRTLMSVLASFESTAMHEREGQLGDVAFTSPQGSVLLFARGNLVVLLQNGGRVIAPVGDLAHRVDRALTERPQVQQRERTAGRSRGGSPAARVGLGESVRLAVDPAIPLSEASDAIPETQTVFASGGTLRREAGGIVFQPGVAGQHHVLVIKRQADERGIAHEFLYQTPADDIGEGDEHRHGSDN